MVQALLFADNGGDADTTATTNCSWDALQSLLADYDGVDGHFRYTLGVVRTVLSFESELPAFIYSQLETLMTAEAKEAEAQMDVFVVPLLEVLCEHGKVIEAP